MKAGRILLAISGGADSIALLHILMALKAQGWIEADLVCAHINHQLRGPASDADEHFVVEQATLLGLTVVTRAVEVRTHARRHRLSLETAARQLRLASLRQFSELFEADFAAVFDFAASAARRNTPGGTAPEAVRRQIEQAKALLSAL